MAGIDVSITYKANAGQATQAGQKLLTQLDAILKQINAIGTTSISAKPFDTLSSGLKAVATDARDVTTAIKTLNANLRALVAVTDKIATNLPKAFASLAGAGAQINAMLPALHTLLANVVGPLTSGMTAVAASTRATAAAVQALNRQANQAARTGGGSGGILKNLFGNPAELARIGVFLNKTLASVTASVQGIGSSIRQGLGSAASSLRAFGTSGASYLRQFSNSLTSIIGSGGFIQKLGAGIGQLAGGFVKFGATAAGSFIAGFGKTVAAIPRIIGDVIKLSGGVISVLTAPFQKAGALFAGLLVSGITNALGGVFKAVSSILTGIADLVGGAVESFGKLIGETITTVFAVGGAIADRIVSTIGDLAGFAADIFAKAFGAALIIGLPLVYRSAKLREELISTFAVVSDEVSQELFQSLIQKAKQVNIDFGVPLDQLPSGLFKTVSQGFGSVEEAVGKYTSAVKLASIGNTELNSAVETINLALVVFGNQVRGAEEVATAFFNATRKGRIEIDDFTSNFGRIAGLAEQNGVAFYDLLASLNIVSRTLPSSSAFIGLSNAIEALNTPSKEASDLLEKLGISFTEIDGSLKSFPKVVELLREAGISAQQLRTLVPEVRGRRALVALISQFKEYDEALRLAKDGQGEFNKALEFSNAQIAKSFKSLVAATESLADTFTEKLRGPLVKVFSFLTSQVRAFEQSVSGTSTGALDKVADRVIEFLTALPAKAERAFSTLSSGVDRVKGFLGQLKLALDENLNLTKAVTLLTSGQFSQAFDAIFGSKAIEKVRGFFDQVVLSARAAMNAVVQMGSAILQTIVGSVTSMLGVLGGPAAGTLGALSGGSGDAIGTATSAAYGASGPLATGRRVLGFASAAPVGAGYGAGIGGVLGGVGGALVGGPAGAVGGVVAGAKWGAVIGAAIAGLVGMSEASDQVAESQKDAAKAADELRRSFQETRATLREVLAASTAVPAAETAARLRGIEPTRARLTGLAAGAADIAARRTDLNDYISGLGRNPAVQGGLNLFAQAGRPGGAISPEVTFAPGRKDQLEAAARDFYNYAQGGKKGAEAVEFIAKWTGLLDDLIKDQAALNASTKNAAAQAAYETSREAARKQIQDDIDRHLKERRQRLAELVEKYRAEFQIRTVRGGVVGYRDEGAALSSGERAESTIRSSSNTELLQALRELITAVKEMSSISVRASELDRARYELEKKRLAAEDPANAPDLQGLNTHARSRIRRARRERERAAGAALNARLNDDVTDLGSGFGGDSIFGIGGRESLRGLAFGGETGFGTTPAAFAGIYGASPARGAAIFDRGLNALNGLDGLGIDPRSGRVANIEELLGGAYGGPRLSAERRRLESRSARFGDEERPDFDRISSRIIATADEAGLGDEIRKGFKDALKEIEGGTSPSRAFRGLLDRTEDRIRGDTDALSAADSVSKKRAREKLSGEIDDARKALTADEASAADPAKTEELIKKAVGDAPTPTTAGEEEAKIREGAGLTEKLGEVVKAKSDADAELKTLAEEQNKILDELLEVERTFTENVKESSAELNGKLQEFNTSNKEVQAIVQKAFTDFIAAIEQTRKDLDAFKASMKR